MNIGVLFKHHPRGGGIYQYFLSIMESLRSAGAGDRVFLYHCYDLDDIHAYRQSGIVTKVFSQCETGRNRFDDPPSLDYKVRYSGEDILFRTKPLTRELRREAMKDGIDLMIYPSPERESFETGIPYIMSVHDFAHLVLQDFEEFSSGPILQQRNYVYGEGIKQGFCILTDSKTGKKQLLDHYPVDAQKVVSIPFIPPPYIERCVTQEKMDAVRDKYGILTPFIFYPAQFWPHKNHENLIKALFILRSEKNAIVPVLFVGSKQDQWHGYQRMILQAERLGITDQVTHLGYVEAKDMTALYRLAAALVMPTYLGPTNLPILEAFKMGCPVVASDIPGTQEQVGDAGILFDPADPKTMAEAIDRVWKDRNLRSRLVEKGWQRSGVWTQSEFSLRFLGVIDRFRKIWKPTGGHLNEKLCRYR